MAQGEGRLKVRIDTREVATAQRALDSFQKSADKTEKTNESLTASATKLAAGFGGLYGIIAGGSQIRDVGLQFESLEQTINFATGSLKNGSDAMAFILAESERLGTELLSTAGGFARLSVSTKDTALEGKATRDIFLGTAEAAAALNKSTEETNGILTALSQIAAKGKVSTEELLQIAERGVPVFKLAADALGVNTAQLNKMLQQGEILSNDFLPKFGQQMRKEFGQAAIDSADKSQKAFNRFRNELTLIEKGLADSAVNPILAEAARSGTAFLNALRTDKDTQDFVKFLGTTAGLLVTGRLAVAAYAGTIGVLKAEQAAGAVTTTAYNVATGATTVVTRQATLATLALNKAMKLTPWGIAIGVAAGLASVITELTDGYDDLAEKTYEAAKAQETLTKAQRAVAIEEAKRKLQELREAYGKLLTSARTGFLGQPSEITDKERAALELLRDRIKETSGVLKTLQDATLQATTTATTNANAITAQGQSAQRSAAQIKLMKDALGAFNEAQTQIRYDLADPTTQLLYQYDQRQRVLDDALAAQAVTEENYNRASLANTELYEKQKTQLVQQQAQQRLQAGQQVLGAAGQLFGNLAELARQGGKEQFQAYKNLASAQAAINAALAITNVFSAMDATPPWLRWGLAGSIAAVTGAQIAPGVHPRPRAGRGRHSWDAVPGQRAGTGVFSAKQQRDRNSPQPNGGRPWGADGQCHSSQSDQHRGPGHCAGGNSRHGADVY